MRHGAVAAYAGLVWVTTSSSSHGPRAARGCDQFLRSEWAIRHFYRYTAQSTFKCSANMFARQVCQLALWCRKPRFPTC